MRSQILKYALTYLFSIHHLVVHLFYMVWSFLLWLSFLQNPIAVLQRLKCCFDTLQERFSFLEATTRKLGKQIENMNSNKGTELTRGDQRKKKKQANFRKSHSYQLKGMKNHPLLRLCPTINRTSCSLRILILRTAANMCSFSALQNQKIILVLRPILNF